MDKHSKFPWSRSRWSGGHIERPFAGVPGMPEDLADVTPQRVDDLEATLEPLGLAEAHDVDMAITEAAVRFALDFGVGGSSCRTS
jgi:hypothetical protein